MRGAKGNEMENTITQNDNRPRFSDRSRGLMEASKTSGRTPHKNQTAPTSAPSAAVPATIPPRKRGNAQETATPRISTARASVWCPRTTRTFPSPPVEGDDPVETLHGEGEQSARQQRHHGSQDDADPSDASQMLLPVARCVGTPRHERAPILRSWSYSPITRRIRHVKSGFLRTLLHRRRSENSPLSAVAWKNSPSQQYLVTVGR
jgi:hypothetical protein